uniref:TSA: Wollemia nobilis Ref_Wollemi_Transcript_1541_2401 transcribed RNA sequence n=1 Tax=Wollemia nobilis TaxID=56998 RepID=A0A0C9RZ07_9CONI
MAAFNPSNYSSSSCLSNANGTCEGSSSATSPSEMCSPEVTALQILSNNIQTLLFSSEDDVFSDAQMRVDDHVVPLHRCILAVRSPFFRALFSAKPTLSGDSSSASTSDSKAKGRNIYDAKELLKDCKVGYEALMMVMGYLYSGKLAEPPAGQCTCVDPACSHDACRPAIDFALQLLYSSFVFQIPELVSLSLRHLLEIVESAYVEDVIPILAVANTCQTGSDPLLTKCIEIIARSNLDQTTFEKKLPPQVAVRLLERRSQLGLETPDTSFCHSKNVRRIQRALDSDDVELVRMLLSEGPVTLDDAYALHYAAAYCDSKITRELLELGNSDVNRRNIRGYSVLHIAAMRKEPTIIVALLTKGADPLDMTADGRNALQISRRLTRAIDYNSSTATGRESPKDRLCIEILEQAERKDPLLGDASHSLALAGDDLRMKLLYLENRVALAKLLFPLEAKLAMDIAHVDSTSEFTGSGTNVDLNETPIAINKEHLQRVMALSKTVELGKRFFPRCSEVLNKIMDDDMSEFTCLEKGTSEEQRVKRQRYDELKAVVTEAFTKDKEDLAKSSLSSSSSPFRDGHRHRRVKR